MTGMGRPKHYVPIGKWGWIGLGVFLLVGFLHREILQMFGW